MIRIIKRLRAQSLDLADGIWYLLPMVPATGQLETTMKSEAAGRLGTAKISATLSAGHDILRDNLILEVTFCQDEDSVVTYGSADLPLRLEVSESDTIKVACTYSYPVF